MNSECDFIIFVTHLFISPYRRLKSETCKISPKKYKFTNSVKTDSDNTYIILVRKKNTRKLNFALQSAEKKTAKTNRCFCLFCKLYKFRSEQVID